MSIVNRYSKLKISEDSINNKWILLFYNNYIISNTELEYQYLSLSIQSVKKIVTIDKIYIYTCYYQHNSLIYDKLVTEYNIELVQIPNIMTSKLFIIKNFLDDKQNILLINHRSIILNNFNHIKQFFINNKNIYSDFELIDFDKNNIYSTLGKRYGFNQLIACNILIIPYTTINHSYIDTAYTMYSELHTNDLIATKISLTITNNKFNNIVHNILNSELSLLLPYDNDQIVNNIIREQKIDNQLIEPIIPYNDSEYMYIPYLDIDSDLTIIDKNNIPDIFNTNGYASTTNIHNPKQLLFRRFNEKTSGIFFKKINGGEIIPRILHHIWLTTDPAINYTNAWGRILREPWKHMIWGPNDIKPNAKWKQLYERETNINIKLLIAAMIILEEFGGVVINSYIIPLQNIPDELLTHKFMITFENEGISGTKLSFRVMASIPNAPIIDKIHKILWSSTENKIDLIQATIMADPDSIIYPSYYFNPSQSTVPKKLLNLAVGINLWESKIDAINPRTRTILQRIYRSDPKAIMLKLNENPRTRLQNKDEI